MNAQEIYSNVQKIISSSGTIALTCSAARSWTAIAQCSIDNQNLVLAIDETYPVDIIEKRPRVSFSAGVDNSGLAVHGNGIARVYRNADCLQIKISPYRYALRSPAQTAAGIETIELRQNEWKCCKSISRFVAASGHDNAFLSMKKRIGFWFRAARAVSWPLSVFPIFIGTAFAIIDNPAHARWMLFIFALTGGVAAHMATNLISDYYDFVKGVDTTNALSSHTGVLVDELVSPERILMAAMLCFIITAFTGGVLVCYTGWQILLFGLAGGIGGFCYTGGPRGWKYLGLGELATGFLMGPMMVLGSYFVQAGLLSVASVLLSIAIGSLVSCVSFSNNIRDASCDSRAGISTIPAKLGTRRTLFLFRCMLFAPYLLLIIAVLLERRLLPVLIAFFALPRTFLTAGKLKGKNATFSLLSEQAAKQIIPLQIIKIHMRFCALLSAGCIIALSAHNFRIFPFHIH